MLPDYYRILGIAAHATQEEIRGAYRRLARRYHPDAGGDAGDFRSLQEAYDVLTDPARRRQYDAQRQARLPRATTVEPLIPPRQRRTGSWQPSRISGFHPQEALENFDRLFREFDEFFERLEYEFLGPYWGRNE